MGEIELEPGEKITRAVRKHWFVLLVSLIPFLLLAWLPTLIIPFVNWIANYIPHSGQVAMFTIHENPFVRLVYGLWLIMLWIAAFNTITRYYLNEWIITNTRVIEIHQYGFFSREVSSLLLIRIQDVSTDTEGLFGTLIGYGRLEVQSAGTEEHFTMDDIPNPSVLRDLIMREIAALHADGLSNASAVSARQSGV